VTFQGPQRMAIIQKTIRLVRDGLLCLMKIRRSTEGDATELARLHRGTIRHVNSSDYSPAQIKAWAGRTSAAKFRRHHQTHVRFVATEQGKIIGFADFGKDGSFGGLYVHKDFVGQGVGTKLIKKLEEMGKKRGVKVFEFLSTKTAKHFLRTERLSVPWKENVSRR